MLRNQYCCFECRGEINQSESHNFISYVVMDIDVINQLGSLTVTPTEVKFWVSTCAMVAELMTKKNVVECKTDDRDF